ncbi:PREDICTED: kinesin-related protein 11-like isoform X2 [Ceratosolen solmsi marchali]|uniref:Kinesin-related protein 11-like isoform X2 n=1 Tax=Ceratosolen solmsi marchali TaxID=326594 RepID=A0AAJ7DU27_9HYME|nr:PREDICTED: kinesin-related protein 11-like isoform X2 [Ceratosolen solmsi marchali]
MSSNIEVAIKVRPLLKKEKEDNLNIQWDIRNYVVTRTSVQSMKRKRSEAEKFYFDHIFDAENTNCDVFERIVKRIVSSAVDGYNGTVIAYGQSNSGKTHTMLGTANDHGIIPQSAKYMFDLAKKLQDRKLTFKVSYFEIYNNTVNDLIDINNTNLKLRQSISNLVQVVSCKEELVSDSKSILNIIAKGEQNRRVRQSSMNNRNDRSHTVLRINIENKDKRNKYHLHNRFSQLNLVDLAGHKSLSNYQSKDDCHINMSLSMLSIIIVQLNRFSDTEKYINFREISPVAIEETQTTLWFAFRAANVRNKPKLNIILFYKLELVTKICSFHRFLKVKMKRLLDKLIQIQEENKLTCQSNPSNCRISQVMKIIKNNRSKFSLDLIVPVINEDDVFSALQQFKRDLEKLHDKLAFLADFITTNENILSLLQSIENDFDHLEPKAVLLETFIDILIKD